MDVNQRKVGTTPCGLDFFLVDIPVSITEQGSGIKSTKPCSKVCDKQWRCYSRCIVPLLSALYCDIVMVLSTTNYVVLSISSEYFPSNLAYRSFILATKCPLDSYNVDFLPFVNPLFGRYLPVKLDFFYLTNNLVSRRDTA